MKGFDGVQHLILVARFSDQYGVGSSAISFCEDLERRGNKVLIVCGRFDQNMKKNRKIISLPLTLPYSMEVIFLSFLGFFLSGRKIMIHSFEIFSSRPRTFHLHSNIWDSKKIGSMSPIGRSFRRIARALIIQGFVKARDKEAILVTPSKSLISRINQKGVLEDMVTIDLPNRLTNNTRTLISKILNDSESCLADSIAERVSIGIVAQGDLSYKGLETAMSIMENLTKDSKLVLIGASLKDQNHIANEHFIVSTGLLNKVDYLHTINKLNGIVITSSYESFSMVALEAIYLGIPVLTIGEVGIMDYWKFGPPLYRYESIQEWIKELTEKSRNVFQRELNEFESLRRDRFDTLMRDIHEA